ncbi:hypothetical protein AALO_G00271250 [Alosa alosa]|uniref:Threonylcarbamoyl-AMP synthase n=1 Tax=Alosa alosa TaxID=278164 RepID=A0AAV6FR86_9TELE|nr:uncharacterized protein si:ch211-153b23.4 [Alosa alosa]KAG5264021.1 hypothetical protein AALO_G00271250 [Alosa alosa]
MADAEIQSLHYSVGVLGISGGSLLLLVNGYGSVSGDSLISSTALGVLLLIIAALLAYSGVRRSLSPAPLFTCLCLTVSALWCASGLLYILVGEGYVNPTQGLRNAMIPGLAAFTLALFILALVAILAKKVVLFIIALTISLACAHQIAGLANVRFGQGATAANYLLVCFVGAYFGTGRLLSYVTRGDIQLPGTGTDKASQTQTQQGLDSGDVEAVGLVMNLLAASVLACPLLGVVPKLFVGHVPWLWTAGVFQLGVCVLCYRGLNIYSATFYGFMAILRFAEGYSALVANLTGTQPYSPVPFPTVFAILFFVLALFSVRRSVADSVYQLFFVAYSIAVAAQPRGFFQGGTQGVQAAIFVATALMLLVSINNKASPYKVPMGDGLLKFLLTRTSFISLRPHDKDFHAPYLGYSKYADAEILGHASSVLAAFAITATVGAEGPLAVLILPWAVVSGGLLQLLCGSVAFSRGKTLESAAFIMYGFMWTVWGLTRFGGLYGSTRGFSVAVGIISFMLFNCLVTVGALYLSVAWFAYAFTFQLILISFLLDAVGALPYGYDIGVTIIFGLVSFYCFLANLFNSTFQKPQMPLGTPLIKLGGTGREKCPHLTSRKATSVMEIAEIMKNGGICGMPTDTVYVLVAACNRPEAVEKAYKTKQHAGDRPMSLWVSSIKQLEPVRDQINPLLWDLMEAAWPSSISLVIPRAPWMDFFGLKDSSKYIGTPQSIAIRNPDCTVATQLISLVGPIAVTSANPTGEADTTHHNQVYAKLGDKVEGVLCDGPSPENIASTVVDCTKIESGNIGFFRVGLIPKSQVLQLFEEVQRKHVRGQMNPGFETDLSDSVGSQRQAGEEETPAEEETTAEMDDSLDTNSASDDSL